MAISRNRLMAMAVLAYLAFAAFCFAAHFALYPGDAKKNGETDKIDDNGGGTKMETIKNNNRETGENRTETQEETEYFPSVEPDWPEYVLPKSELIEPDGFLGIDAVVVGKDGYLYEPWYINEYLGYDYAYVYTDDDELMRRVMILKLIQEELEKRGIAFCVAISASKASSMPQFIPEFYKDSHYKIDDGYVRPYVRFVKMLKEKGICHIDSQSLFRSIGLTNSFAKTGTHWNKLASFEATRAVMQEIDRQTGRNIEKLVFDEIAAKKTPAPFYPNEQDIFNIGYAGNRQEMRNAIVDDFYYWPEVYLEQDGKGDRLGHTVIQGGSFSHDFVYYFRDKKIASSVTAYYYNNDGKVDVDWEKEIGRAEFVLFEVNEQHVYNMGGGVPGDSSTNIIDSLYFWLAGHFVD